ncbi:MAG: asparaginase [Vicinamibacterales bacterium]
MFAALRGASAALLILIAAGCTASAQSPSAPALPRVHLVATGGTISNRDGGRLTAEELATSMPGLDKAATLTHEQFLNVASSQITLPQWLQLSRRINQLFAEDRGLAGIVVTSGTDTLEETAFFLHLTVRDARPVVVVGSMRNPSTLGYEGAANLLEGVRVAAEPASRGKGVLVVLNDEINSARDVTKTDALRLQTFRSPTHGLLGVVDRDRVAFFRQILGRHTAVSEFDLQGVTELPRVDVFMVYQGASGDLIKAAVDLGAKGLVMAGAGAGAVSGTQNEGLDYAASKGVFIVSGTRTGAGRIIPNRGPGPDNQTPEQQKRRAMTIQAEDHIPVKARILLMLALTKTSSRDEIQRMFSEY